MGRNTQGVRLMRPNEGDRLVGLDRVESEDSDEAASPGGGDEGASPAGGESG
jgi:DNA gyrase subunit A